MSKKSVSVSPVGAGSLLATFAILCLTVFALLSLTTARRDQRLSDSAHQSVTQFYAADLQAQEIFARLRAGEAPSQVSEDHGTYTYSIPISQHSRLDIALENTGEHWSILRWQLIAELPENDQPLGVWTKQEESS